MCLRLAGAPEEIVGQVGVFDQGTSATITALSRPVSAITGEKKRTVRRDTFSSLLAVVLFVDSTCLIRYTSSYPFVGASKLRTAQAHAVATFTHQGDAGRVKAGKKRNDHCCDIGFAKIDTEEKRLRQGAHE